MARRLLQLLALWTTVVGNVQCCPELCSCQDKFAHQFADCAYKDLLVVPVGLPTNVTTVSLSANKIKLLKSKSFISITQVSSLWLAHNEIVTIETDSLAPLIQLRNLDISYNKIVNFPWEDLHNLTALQLLKMNNNEMVNLPKDAFSTLKDLRSLRINNNKFITIVQGTFSALSSMSHLQIFNNPFTCSCSLEWLRDWITTTKISIPEPKSIVCEAPEHLKGTMVTLIPKLDCMQSNCLHLIPALAHENYGGYECVSKEKDDTKVVKTYQFTEQMIPDTNKNTETINTLSQINDASAVVPQKAWITLGLAVLGIFRWDLQK
ncbi:immunoglobulin superfamily containing leucine-rich repeat protein 2-like [Anarrhichthys ocellatus]|uniref:immunoglobulin superfamily containing leucine-rich repeat protein 2-like n=1 Tax=Anarrhichthys ocellatus TaxID=433405 RepID=UPI0012ED449F|nr:immunoglobulin superfamily containing leucine-rich repeat protein 2-like [Anarrhichthys ocellatus]